MFGRWVVGVILLFVILLMMLPDTDEQSLARIASTSMLMCTKEQREQVASQVLAAEGVEVEAAIACPELIAALEISEQGKMVIRGKEHPLTIWLEPVIEGDKVRWSCRGEPAELVTKLCKE
ncbi:MAG TPA: hypothetical protein VIQ22_05800 [Gammaproteobacteria bacterium]